MKRFTNREKGTDQYIYTIENGAGGLVRCNDQHFSILRFQ